MMLQMFGSTAWHQLSNHTLLSYYFPRLTWTPGSSRQAWSSQPCLSQSCLPFSSPSTTTTPSCAHGTFYPTVHTPTYYKIVDSGVGGMRSSLYILCTWHTSWPIMTLARWPLIWFIDNASQASQALMYFSPPGPTHSSHVPPGQPVHNHWRMR